MTSEFGLSGIFFGFSLSAELLVAPAGRLRAGSRESLALRATPLLQDGKASQMTSLKRTPTMNTRYSTVEMKG